ncbi:MAG: hypothetical protein LBV32_01680 [Tannerellaceae bacterium]|nr:hypothetical protein [Tannerellaceae bacterium]
MKPTEEPALKPEIINRRLKPDGKRQACGHELRSLPNYSDYFDYFKGDREGRPYVTTFFNKTNTKNP